MALAQDDYPDWGMISPHGDEWVDYVQTTNWALKDVFNDYKEVHQPELDAPKYLKRRGIEAARTIAEETEENTVGEVADLCGFMDLADERDVAEVEVTPQVLAVLTYADVVHSLDWAVSELGAEWDTETAVLVYDSLRDLAAH
jgi:hypothetical protein